MDRLTRQEIEEVRKRYTADVVPSCRVCGGELSIASFGGGNAAVWACSPMETDPDNPGMARYKRDRGRNAKDRFADDEHYSESRWTQYRGGDQDVLKLCDLALQSLSQEAGRDEAQKDALRIVARMDEYAANLQHRNFMGHQDWMPIDIQDWEILSRALKREPNAAAQASGSSEHTVASANPAPAAPDVESMVKRLREPVQMRERKDIDDERREAATLLSRLGQGWIPVDRTAEYQEHHFKVDDVGVAWNGNRVWVCADSGALLRAKVIGEKLFVEFTPPPPERP